VRSGARVGVRALVARTREREREQACEGARLATAESREVRRRDWGGGAKVGNLCMAFTRTSAPFPGQEGYPGGDVSACGGATTFRRGLA
jgi:hypothetical protein